MFLIVVYTVHKIKNKCNGICCKIFNREIKNAYDTVVYRVCAYFGRESLFRFIARNDMDMMIILEKLANIKEAMIDISILL